MSGSPMNRLPQTDRSPLPTVDERSAPHWEGLARGVVTLPRCRVCRVLNHPVAELCRECDSPQLEWEEVGDRVRLFSWAVEVREVIQGMAAPYVVVQVVPEECGPDGVRLIGTLLADPEGLVLGDELVLRPAVAPGSDVHLATYVRP